MKRKILIVTLLAALLVLTACAQKEQTPEGNYQLYYLTHANEAGGADAIAESPVYLADEGGTTEELARELVELLLLPPEETQYLSPFPGGTKLQELSVSGKRASVDFSAIYGRLSGIDLSLADYCVTLTLTQLDGINAVTITADGRELPYRKTQLLTEADPLLGSREDALRPITVQLYFLDTQTLELRAQQQTIALYEGQPRVNALLDALLAGPEGDDALQCLLPPDFSMISARIEEGTCYFNLPSDLPLPEGDREQRLMLDSLVYSLCSLSGVEQVQIMLDGESAEALGTLAIGEPLCAPEQSMPD